MEERIIDDEYGRGIRLKKTKDGYVDVTDELAPETDENVEAEAVEAADEVAFAFPTLEADETDEDLIGLSPEEVAKKLQQREEEAARRRAKGAKFCDEGEKALEEKRYDEAKTAFTKALKFVSRNEESEKEVEFATRCRLGMCKALTEDFENPDALCEEYVEEGVENFEYDLGYETVQTLRKEHTELFKKRYAAIVEEEAPLAKSVEGKQEKRRAYLKSRMLHALIAFCISLLPVIGFAVAAVAVGMKNYTTRGNEYVMPTIVLGALTFVCFIVFIVFANKLINAFRMRYKNEKLEATDDGERLVYLRAMKELYEFLLESHAAADADAETDEN